MSKVAAQQYVNRYGDELKFILDVMCEMVGTNFDDIDWSNPFYHSTYKWLPSKSKEFQEWLTMYLIDNEKIRRKLVYDGSIFGVSGFVSAIMDMFTWELIVNNKIYSHEC